MSKQRFRVTIEFDVKSGSFSLFNKWLVGVCSSLKINAPARLVYFSSEILDDNP